MKLIEFLIDHFQILIPVAIIVISALSTSKKGKGGSEKRPLSPQERQQQAAEEQRVREIQEEIRRKIAERTGGASGTQAQQSQRARPQPQQSRSREPQRSSQGHKEYTQPSRSRQMDAPRSSGSGHKYMPEHDSPHGMSASGSYHQNHEDPWAAKVAEQERLVKEQLQEAKRLEGRLKGGGAPIGGAFPEPGSGKKAVVGGVQASLLKDLRSTRGQRKAMLLREVLGTPVGMRKPGGSVL